MLLIIVMVSSLLKVVMFLTVQNMKGYSETEACICHVYTAYTNYTFHEQLGAANCF